MSLALDPYLEPHKRSYEQHQTTSPVFVVTTDRDQEQAKKQDQFEGELFSYEQVSSS